MKKHNFQPITAEDRYMEAVEYVANQAMKLAKHVLGQDLGLDTVTIFAHSAEEFSFLEQLLKREGKISPYSHDTTLYVEKAIRIAGQQVTLLGVRQPDSSRLEIGYADFPVADYNSIKVAYSSDPRVREIISGSNIPLLELRDKEFDVRSYIIEE